MSSYISCYNNQRELEHFEVPEPVKYETPMTKNEEEIEKVKAQIKVLQSKLSFLEELEKTKSPVEEAFKEFYGAYPITDIADTSWDSDGWIYFEAGYNAAYEEKVKEWEPTPQTPEQVADGLKEAFREAVKQGVVSSSTKQQTLYDVIYDWWDDHFTFQKDATMHDLVDRIEEWLPKEQSAAGSQNVYVECTVEGFNDCLNKIKRKLR